jgi:prolyl 4-hydroxylase
VDPMSLHGGLPVVKGIKWAMTKWIRQKPFY